MKLAIFTHPKWELTIELQKHIDFDVNTIGPDCEQVIIMSESFLRQIPETMKQEYFCYQWDCYDWRGNPERWVELMKGAKEVWTPSIETTKLTYRRYGIASHLIRIFAPSVAEYTGEITRGDYIMAGARRSPEIRWEWLEKACNELNIPLFAGDPNKYSRMEYLEKLAGCRFVVSTRDEASTGGLTLFEGARFHKPILAADCESTIEYFGILARYFKKDNYEDFKMQLKDMWDHDGVDPYAIAESHTVERMAKEIISRL